MVYFITGGNLVKIGTAKNPANRLRDLQCGSPVPLYIVALMEGDKAEESALHQRFRDSRSHGEWFHRSPELEALLQEHALDESLSGFVVWNERESRRLKLSDEERQRRSEHMRKLHAQGRAGGEFGKLGGRPAKRRV